MVKSKHCLIFICIVLVLSLGVAVYVDAANTGLSVHSSDDTSDDDTSTDDVSPSTSTDLEELKDAFSSDDRKVIFLEHGTLSLENVDEAVKGSAIEDPEVDRSDRSVNANDFGYFINVSCSLGNRIYVPADYANECFYITPAGQLYGMHNSTFQSYCGSYTIRFPAYSTPQYRLTNSSQYTWQDIDIDYVSSPNVEVLGARFNWFSDRGTAVLILVILGVALWILFIKRS